MSWPNLTVQRSLKPLSAPPSSALRPHSRGIVTHTHTRRGYSFSSSSSGTNCTPKHASTISTVWKRRRRTRCEVWVFLLFSPLSSTVPFSLFPRFSRHPSSSSLSISFLPNSSIFSPPHHSLPHHLSRRRWRQRGAQERRRSRSRRVITSGAAPSLKRRRGSGSGCAKRLRRG